MPSETPQPYRFPGMKAFTDQAASDADVDASALASAPSIKKVGDILAQTPGNTPEHKAETRKMIKAERAALLAQIAAIDAAAAEVHGDPAAETAEEVLAKGGLVPPPAENLAIDRAKARSANPPVVPHPEDEAKKDDAPKADEAKPVAPPTPKPPAPVVPPKPPAAPVVTPKPADTAK